MLDFSQLKLVSLRDRHNLFSIENTISLDKSAILLDNKDLTSLSENILEARSKDKPFIFMMGSHLMKLGLSPFVIDLMKRGVITHVAMNGSGPIHDFEIAYIGATSEDVKENLKDGSFGMSDETGHYINEAAKKAYSAGTGLGYSIGKMIGDLDLKYKDFSIAYHTHKFGIPLTVHTAIGTEIIYQHPECDGAALGASSYTDFKILADSISKLEEGVVVNVGSAIILPEVFLKAFTIARNLGFKVDNFTAANMDMINHYRPRTNVVERPTSFGGKGYVIIDKHEKTLPTLHYLLTKNDN